MKEALDSNSVDVVVGSAQREDSEGGLDYFLYRTNDDLSITDKRRMIGRHTVYFSERLGPIYEAVSALNAISESDDVSDLFTLFFQAGYEAGHHRGREECK